MIGILGSGFGLYGYLPAAVELGCDRVCLLRRAELNFHSRPELAIYSNRIRWVDTTNELLDLVDTLIVSLPPIEQFKVIRSSMSSFRANNVILEKPVAHNPEASKLVLEHLKTLGKNFRVGYILLYTSWYKELVQSINKLQHRQDWKITIDWNFQAYHYKNNLKGTWKTNKDLGGGIVRFYGIHIIAVLNSLAFTNILSSHIFQTSEIEQYQWSGTFLNKSLCKFSLNLNANSRDECFQVSVTREGDSNPLMYYSNSSPFDSSYTNADARVSFLVQMLKDLECESLTEASFSSYQNVHNLWEKIEANSRYYTN